LKDMGIPEKDDDKKANGHMSWIWRGKCYGDVEVDDKWYWKWSESDRWDDIKEIKVRDYRWMMDGNKV